MSAQNASDEVDGLAEWYGRVIARYADSPIHQTMGLSIRDVTAGAVEMLLQCPPEFRNAHGTIHGGVLMTALDSAILQAVRSQTLGIFAQSTIELNVNFMRPAVDATVLVEGTAIHVGRTTGVGRAIALSSEGRPIAAALGTIHIARDSAT